MKCGTVKDIEKAEVRPDEELAHAIESLGQIADGIEEWIKKQSGRFEHTTKAFRKKWISDWFSDFYIMELFEDKEEGREFDDIVDTFRLHMSRIAGSLRGIRDDFLRSVKFMQKIEEDKDKVEANHDLGFWCVNFFDTTAIPTVERLRHFMKRASEFLATQKQAETVTKRPEGVLNRQVGELLRSCPPDISASEIAGILNANYVAEYEPVSPCSVGKTGSWKRHCEKKKNHSKN
jgi:hypothetical protein